MLAAALSAVSPANWPESISSNWDARLASALTEILAGRKLKLETAEARARALAVLDEIEQARQQSKDD